MLSADARPLDGARTGNVTLGAAKQRAEAKLDHFAELLSLDIPIPLIAERMGIAKGSAYVLLCKLRERLGPQAC